MSQTIKQAAKPRKSAKRIVPSIADPAVGKPFTLEQELTTFGHWVDKSIWVPPMDRSKAMAQTMLEKRRLRATKEKRWSTVIKKHRANFTQVREIDLVKASIRLPEGKFYVEVTEKEDFGYITDSIPACVQTRLDEFMAGPGRQPGVKVYYLKPLCVEVGDDLILTTREDLLAAISKIQKEVFADYRRLYLRGLPLQLAVRAMDLLLAVPKSIMKTYVDRKEQTLDEFQAKMEFRRRRTALRAAKAHRKCFTTGCTFDEMLDMTGDLKREDVIEQYSLENELSRAERDRLLRLAAGTLPWFVALSLALTYVASASAAKAVAASPVLVADPAFVAEMPDAPGELLKIGHFDEVAGVTHVEI